MISAREAAEKSRLFASVPKESVDAALALYRSRAGRYKKGDALVSAGEAMPFFGIVVRGAVRVSSEDIDGGMVIMNVVPEGGSFGESLCWLSAPEVPVRIVAVEETEILWLSPDFMRGSSPPDKSEESLVGVLRGNFMSLLAQRTLSMNERIQILSRVTLREKLTVFFSICSRGGTVKTFSIPFDRESLGVYLGVNRSSLSRELAAMKREGIIDFYKNSFRLLK